MHRRTPKQKSAIGPVPLRIAEPEHKRPGPVHIRTVDYGHIGELKKEASDLTESKNFLMAASKLKEAAKELRKDGDRKASAKLSIKSAELSEQGHNFIGAVLIYIDLKMMRDVKRIAHDASKELGDSSALAPALDRLAKAEDGSKEEARAIHQVKRAAHRFNEARERFLGQKVNIRRGI
jgi:hypothetical protein